ncbi:glycosyltransferase [Parasedimentitalea maritima]|uniref:Glycosyltransferase n=1 Tax=Parasedimentitalea maritima TaxID=2578117 RepID=A0ABY2USR6_9RHOB|nr:glycosyltransferase [Zongyanglinia marina]TLP60294.1 glycosyltransferase [Zongyanglinia marina]
MNQILIKLKPLALRLLGQKRYLALRARALPLISSSSDVAAQEAAAQEHDKYNAKIMDQSITFSIVVPIYNTPERFLRQCLQSVYDQIYPHWELILVDDKSPAPHVRKMMEEAAAKTDKVKLIYRTENGNISASVNSGLKAATGDYFTVLDHDDILSNAALYWMVDALIQHPEAEYLYSDEDKTDEGGQRFFGAFIKPGWSPELTLQCMYSCHMSVYDRVKAQSIGGCRSEFDGAQDFDFMLRYISRFGQVHHVDKVLYHWREWEQSTAQNLDAKPEAFLRQRAALKDYLDAKNESYEIGDHPLRGHHKVSFQPRRDDKVSIVIPTANGTLELDSGIENNADAVVASIIATSTYDNYEIVLAHNGDLSDSQMTAFEAEPLVRLIEYDDSMSFNLADKINQGAAAAAGDYILLMNDDIRVITPNWLELMLGMAQRPGVGCVGAKLLFPNGTIQHNGVWMRGHLAGHIDYEAERRSIGHDLSGLGNRNCIGVTGACKMTARTVWEDLGGYSTTFRLNYNDVDYCLRLHEKGLRSVCLGDVELYHYEGVSKEGGPSVLDGEIELFLDVWSNRVPVDPYLPANLV